MQDKARKAGMTKFDSHNQRRISSHTLLVHLIQFLQWCIFYNETNENILFFMHLVIYRLPILAC